MPLSCHKSLFRSSAIRPGQESRRSWRYTRRLLTRLFESTLDSASARGKLTDKEFLPTPFTFAEKIIAVKKGFGSETLRPQRPYEHLPVLRLAFLVLMLIFSCIVLGIPLIVGASGGVSPPVGIFEGLFSRFGPQVSRLHSRQNLLVPPECETICDTFQTTVRDCPDAACACTVQNMNTGLSCVECAVSEIPGEVTTAQTVLNNFAQECAVYGSSLNVPTVTLSGGVTPSAGSGPTDGAPTGSSAPPTGIPSSDFNGVTNAASTTSSPSQTGPISSTTGSAGSKSGAIRVGKRAEVICVLFSVCLSAVLASVP